MLLVEIKDFKALIDNKSFFNQPLKTRKKMYEKLIEMSGNDDQNFYKLLRFNLPRQANTNISQQFNFTGKLEKDDGAVMFLLLKSSKKLF